MKRTQHRPLFFCVQVRCVQILQQPHCDIHQHFEMKRKMAKGVTKNYVPFVDATGASSQLSESRMLILWNSSQLVA
jgi:hypothetical protein